MRNYLLDNNESAWTPQSICPSSIDIDWGKVELNRYTSQENGPLLDALARYTGFPKDQLVADNGGDILIRNVFTNCSGPEKKIMLTPPTFGLYYNYAQQVGNRVFDVELTPDFQLQVDQMIEVLQREEIGMVMICHPNNPTGNNLPVADILRIIENTESIVVVDEAYYEFGGVSLQEYVDQYDNLIILRTMSKAFAAAGLRLGYAITNPALRKHLRSFQGHYNISNIVQHIAASLLDHFSGFEGYMAEVKEIREVFRNQLNAIEGVKALPSCTNFILLELSKDPDYVFDELAKRKIKTRRVCHTHPLVSKMLRISVGSLTDNQIACEALEEILQ